MALPRAVLDTNLLVRGVIKPQGTTGRLLDEVVREAYELVTSEPLLDELANTLRYPRLTRFGPWTEADITSTIGVLRRIADVVPGDYEVDLVPTDLRDNPVVACALEAGAAYLVTDDRRDLLPLKVIRVRGHRIVQVVSAPDFLRLVRPSKR